MPKLWNETIEAHRRAVHEAILNTTAALVAEHGLRSVTMSQIAEEAGIGRATLYKYFSDVDAILLTHGPLLLKHWFPFDLSVHVLLSPGALRRRTPEREHWTLPAFERYESETDPAATADVLVRADDPRHPAWNG